MKEINKIKERKKKKRKRKKERIIRQKEIYKLYIKFNNILLTNYNYLSNFLFF